MEILMNHAVMFAGSCILTVVGAGWLVLSLVNLFRMYFDPSHPLYRKY